MKKYIFIIILSNFFSVSRGQECIDTLLHKTNYVKIEKCEFLNSNDKKVISKYFKNKLNISIDNYYVLNCSFDSISKSKTIILSFMTLNALNDLNESIKTGVFKIGCCYGTLEFDDFEIYYNRKYKTIKGKAKRE